MLRSPTDARLRRATETESRQPELSRAEKQEPRVKATTLISFSFR